MQVFAEAGGEDENALTKGCSIRDESFSIRGEAQAAS
jgi:hypothetical protein